METGTMDYLATGDSSELFRKIAPYFYPTLKAVTSGKRTIPAGFSSINAVSLIDMVRRKLPAGHQFTEDSEEILRQRALEAAGRVNHVRQVRVKAGQYFEYAPPNDAAQRYARKWATKRGWDGKEDSWVVGVTGVYQEYAPNKDVLITNLVRMCGRFLMTDSIWAHHSGLLKGYMYLEFDGSKWNCFCFQHMHAL